MERKKLNKDELLEILDLCEKRTLFGGYHYLAGTALRIRQDENYYLRQMLERAFDLGYKRALEDTNK